MVLCSKVSTKGCFEDEGFLVFPPPSLIFSFSFGRSERHFILSLKFMSPDVFCKSTSTYLKGCIVGLNEWNQCFGLLAWHKLVLFPSSPSEWFFLKWC